MYERNGIHRIYLVVYHDIYVPCHGPLSLPPHATVMSRTGASDICSSYTGHTSARDSVAIPFVTTNTPTPTPTPAPTSHTFSTTLTPTSTSSITIEAQHMQATAPRWHSDSLSDYSVNDISRISSTSSIATCSKVHFSVIAGSPVVTIPYICSGIAKTKVEIERNITTSTLCSGINATIPFVLFLLSFVH